MTGGRRSPRSMPLLDDDRSVSETTGGPPSIEPDHDNVDANDASPQIAATRPLHLLAVVSIVFFNVSGGPLGSEAIVSSCGPIVGLSAILVFAVCYSVPQAMITAEMSTMFPCNGGYSIWVQAAFGNFWSVQESYWSWFSGVVDSALYPVLLYSTAQQLLSGLSMDILPATEMSCANASSNASAGDDDEPTRNLWSCMLTPGSGCAQEYGIKLGTLLIFALPNLISSKVVGDFLTALCLFALAPFAVLCALGVPKMRLKNLKRAPKEYDWATCLSTLYWNMTGFDSASTFAGEVAQPHKTFPRALFAAVGTISLAYLLPLLVSAAADPQWDCWDDGSLVSVALLIGGSWLGIWMLATSSISNWGLFASELLEDSYQLLGMAEMGLAPRIFSHTSRRTGTPINAILIQLLIIGALVSLDFNSILCIDNFFTAAAATLEFAAIVRLRVKSPHMARPFRIPLGTVGLVLMLTVPMLWSLLICYVTISDSIESAITISVGIVVGLMLYLPFLIWFEGDQLNLEMLSRQATLITPNPAMGALLKRASTDTGRRSARPSARPSERGSNQSEVSYLPDEGDDRR